VEEDGVDIDDPELLAAIEESEQQIDRGEGMEGFEFLRQLRDGTWRER
jgi:hypothetical protein